jgi:DNA-binding winged helix-turn-helix (wHTH) protein/TolB-like protein
MKSGGWRFGAFVLIPAEHTLLRNGDPIRLARKDFDLLVALVERAGQLVRKEDLLQLLWPDSFVEESNLTKHVSTLRKALGEGGDSDRLIETVPKVGWRFMMPVTAVDGMAPPAISRRAEWRWIIVAAIAFTAAITISGAVWWYRNQPAATGSNDWKALAVLPFTPLEGHAEPVPSLGIGLADGIITRLSGQRLLPVRPTSLVRGYATATARDVKTVGQKLGADVVLEGNIQRAGDIVRVTVQLSDVQRGAPIWGETFDEPMTELFRLEDTIAERVAGELRLQIGAAGQERLKRRYTENAEAYGAYLAGRDALLQYTADSTRAAVAFFQQALARDRSYTLARAGLAMASADMYLRFASAKDQQQWGEQAEREAATALAIDPDLAEAHLARAVVLRKREFDWEQAIVESQRALTLNSSLDQAHLIAAAAYYHLGLMDRARGELERSRGAGVLDRVEPLRVEALIALFSGDFPTARQHLEEVSHQSSREIGDTYLALTYFYSGEVDRARRLLERLSTDESASTAARSTAALAGILATLDGVESRRLIDAVLQRPYRDHHVAYSLGAAYAQLGDEASAMRWLRWSAQNGFPCAIWYMRDPLIAPLRTNADFKQLLSELEQRRATIANRYRE